MKRVIQIENVYGTNNKYIFKEEYNGFGIYQRKTPSGYFVHQDWLISDNKNTELVINSYNRLCKEEVLDIIDNYNETNKFGVRVVTHSNLLCMHPCGTMA